MGSAIHADPVGVEQASTTARALCSQVVDSFIRHTSRPMLLCAPMYAPFYGPEGSSQPRLFREPPIATFPAFVSYRLAVGNQPLWAGLG